jgi:hypothetical protein
MPDWLLWTTKVLYALLPWALWVVFWLCCVNWKKAWPVLAQGGWAPVVLLLFISAEVWSRIAPGACGCLGFMIVPNFWWQLGFVCTLAAIALFCGWLQSLTGWSPVEVSVEPAPVAHGHGHDHHGGHH